MEYITVLPIIPDNTTFDCDVKNRLCHAPNTEGLIVEGAKNLTLFQIGHFIHLYYFPIIIAIGLIGNSLSFIVMIYEANQRISFCVYMSVLAISDNSMLLVGLYWWVYSAAVTNHIFTSVECKIFVYLMQLFSTYGVFLIVGMTVDRFIAIKFPLRARSVCTPKRARYVAGVLLLVLLVYSIPFYIYSDTMKNNTSCQAMVHGGIFAIIFVGFNVCINAVIPFCVIIRMNSYLMRKMLARSKVGSNIQVEKQSETERPVRSTHENMRINQILSREHQLDTILLLVSFTFLLFTLPQYIRYTVCLFINNKSSSYSFAVFYFFFNISNKLYFTHNMVNFFLYCISGSKFRHDLARLCGCWYRKTAGQSTAFTRSTKESSESYSLNSMN